jgi:hypothetical protein
MLELLKVELSKKGTIHRLRMEKEFEVLSKAWDTLAELRLATDGLFPSGLQPRLEGEDQGTTSKSASRLSMRRTTIV